MASSQKFLEWVEWNRSNERELPPMTNTQARFAEKLLNDETLERMMNHPGDILSIFRSVLHYQKNREEKKPDKKTKL